MTDIDRLLTEREELLDRVAAAIYNATLLTGQLLNNEPDICLRAARHELNQQIPEPQRDSFPTAHSRPGLRLRPMGGSPMTLNPYPPLPTTDADRLVAGECLHGHPEQCTACQLTRLQIVTLRRVVSRGKPPR